ncbi:MAG TPA: nucleoid-associated protein [Armatimonadota bacterium]|nr:nucleoid-associated protein [Armatimonadota bacterium]
MQSIKNISLEWAIIHTADSAMGSPQLCQEPVELDDELRGYFEEHIKSCLRSSQLRMAKYATPEGSVAGACARIIDEGPECFMDVSHAIGWWLHKQVGRENGVTVDLAICPFIDTDSGNRYVALLKLDPMRVYLRRGDRQIDFEQILVLPTASHGLATWALLRPYDEEARYDVLYRASSEDGFWLPSFLECEEIASPRQMTKLVLSETSKWLDANAEAISPEIASDLSKAVKEAAQQDYLDLEELAERVIPNSEMRDDFIGRLLDKGLTETRFEPDTDWAERQSRKTTYVLDDGVTISGPYDVIDDVVQILPKSDDGKTRIVIESRKFYQK